MRTKFDRENGAKFGPKCCEIKQLRPNICYEFSEQYQLGTILQNSNLNVVKTSTETSLFWGCLSKCRSRGFINLLMGGLGRSGLFKIVGISNNRSCQLLYLLVLISASFLGHIKLWFNSLKYHSAEVVLHPQKSHSNKCRSNERHTGASEETIFRKFQSRFPTTTRILLHLSIFAKIF